MSVWTRILGQVADPTRLLRRRHREKVHEPPCSPTPPRDPPPVRPPDGGCSTGPDPRSRLSKSGC
jgi:hypothetical protein